MNARLGGSLVAAAIVITAPREALAEQPLFPVRVHDETPAAEHRLFTNGELWARCTGNCVFQVPRGTYRFESSEVDDVPGGEGRLVVRGPTTVEVKPGSQTKLLGGLTMAVIGTAAMCVGVIGTMIAIGQNHYPCEHDCDGPEREPVSYTPWIASLAGGMAIAIPGWIIFISGSTTVSAAPTKATITF